MKHNFDWLADRAMSGLAPSSGSGLTCIDVRAAYQASGCCGNPNALIVMPSSRRLFSAPASSFTAPSSKTDILTEVSIVLRRAQKEGKPDEARLLAAKIRNTV